MTRRAAALGAGLLVLLPVLAGCANTVDRARQQVPTVRAAATPSPTAVGTTNCTPANVTASYQASRLSSPGDLPPAVANVFKGRKYLIVGTAGDVPLWGDRGTDNQLTGFDILLSRQIAKALFGSEQAVRFRTINYAQRIPFLQSGTVDIVAHTMTINCDRWKQIDFSTEYYRAHQSLLVRTDSGITGVSALAGRQVCVAAGSTNLANIRRAAPRAQLTVVSDLGDCLVRFQQGTVDAITGDDTVLAGFASQDRGYATVLSRNTFSDEPYGIGVSARNPQLTRFVNAVLDRLRSDGTLRDIYSATMGTVPAYRASNWKPPAAVYGRTRSS